MRRKFILLDPDKKYFVIYAHILNLMFYGSLPWVVEKYKNRILRFLGSIHNKYDT